MLKWFGKQNQVRGFVGVEIRSEGIAIAHVLLNDEQLPLVSTCQFHPCEDEFDEQLSLLRQLVSQLGLAGYPCTTIMPSNKYTLQLIERPNVESAELKAAVRWVVKDALDFHIDDAILDVFDLPEDAVRGRQRMMYVVAARQSAVEDVVSIINGAGLVLQNLDIAELAMRNIAELCPEDQQGIALVRLMGAAGSVNMAHNGYLYLARQYDLGYSGLDRDSILEEESFVLELLRSLDYYERQMGQVPPSHIVITGDGVGPDSIPSSLQENFSSTIKALEFSQLFAVTDEVDVRQMGYCIGALGAALRQEASA